MQIIYKNIFDFKLLFVEVKKTFWVDTTSHQYNTHGHKKIGSKEVKRDSIQSVTLAGGGKGGKSPPAANPVFA